MKILIIIPYFGILPAWIEYFLLSCAYNPTIHWLLYSDCKFPDFYSENIHFENKSLDDFNKLASNKLNLNIKIINPYKICDLRPAFGHIFSDYIKGYDFWGYADLDLIFGDIKSFLPDELLKEHHIISVREHYLAGHFAMYKNSPVINNLYSRSEFYKEIFQDTGHHYSFDERSSFLGKKLSRHHGGVKNWRKFYIWISLIQRIWIRLHPTLWKTEYPDINTITQKASKKGELKLYRKDLVRSDIWFKKHNIRQWEIIWKDGVIIDPIHNKSFLHFHFIRSKTKKDFDVEPYRCVNEFIIRSEGIIHPKKID